MVKIWRDQINIENNNIENDNHINKNMQKIIMDEEKEHADKDTIFFADLWRTIDYDGQHIIEGFKCIRGEVKLGKYRDSESDDDIDDTDGDEESTVYSRKSEIINYETARTEGNWIWLIYATRETHISVIKCNNIWEDRAQMLNAEKRLQTLKYKSGSFYHHLLTFSNGIEIAMGLGSRMTQIDGILWLMDSLPDDLFEAYKRDFRNNRLLDKFPTEYDKFVEQIKDEYDRMRINYPRLVATYANRKQNQRDEGSFAIGEEKQKKKGGKVPQGECSICKGSHPARDCEYRDTRYPIDSNKWYYETYIKDKKASNEDNEETNVSSAKGSEDDDRGGEEEEPKLAEDKTKASKGTVARKPIIKTESANYCREVKIEDVAVTRELTTDDKSGQNSTTVEPVYIEDYNIFNLNGGYVGWNDLHFDNPDKYYVIDDAEEWNKLKTERKHGALLKGGDSDKKKGNESVKIKDNPARGGEMLNKATMKKKNGQGVQDSRKQVTNTPRK
jgi:hypothetical protein